MGKEVCRGHAVAKEKKKEEKQLRRCRTLSAAIYFHRLHRLARSWEVVKIAALDLGARLRHL